MSVNRRDANLQKLKEADDIQEKTRAAVLRIQQTVVATEEIAVTSLDELRKQGQQMDEINKDLEGVDAKLDKSGQLQNRFDRWAFNWLGGKKRAAVKEARNELAMRSEEGLSIMKEVFENEKYDSLSRTWRPVGMTMCSDPTKRAPQIFDPAMQEKSNDSTWLIDYSMTGIDPEGWTYASSVDVLISKGFGESTPKWNSYVRRRKWRHSDKKQGGGALQEVKDRHVQRVTTKPQNGAMSNMEKIGYIPRDKVPVLRDTGVVGRNKPPGEDQELDLDSAAGLERLREKDAEIDDSLGDVLKVVDNLDNISKAMNEEVKSQTFKTRAIESNLSIVEEKQTIVNARQKRLLKTN